MQARTKHACMYETCMHASNMQTCMKHACMHQTCMDAPNMQTCTKHAWMHQTCMDASSMHEHIGFAMAGKSIQGKTKLNSHEFDTK